MAQCSQEYEVAIRGALAVRGVVAVRRALAKQDSVKAPAEHLFGKPAEMAFLASSFILK